MVLLLTVVAGCQESAPVESLAGVRRTLDEVGVRLSQVKSERELTAVATRQDTLLAWLKSRNVLRSDGIPFGSGPTSR